MRNSIFKITFKAFLLVLCLSCSSDDNDGSTNTDDTFLTAKVNGVDFEVRGSLFAVNTPIGNANLTFMGASYPDDSKSIVFGITNLSSVGTYSLFDSATHDAETSTYVSSLIYGEGDTGWHANFFLNNVSATVTITELSASYIIGTFQFVGVDIDSQTEKNITNGSFKFKRIG